MTEQTNFQIPPTGFGSYLQDILPEDIAISAGAFAASMQQIKNIQNVDFEQFSQVAMSIEATTKGLNLINGTNVPTDITLADSGISRLALGSGPNGCYTVSDFFGCMSGLPYSWVELQNNILATQTTKLSNIYNQLYLATTWEPAILDIQYTSAPGPLYTITGITILDSGGGYGRGSAVAPTITIAGGSGATATCTIGTDSSISGSNGNGTFGRITSVTLTSPGIATATIPTITIECPPTAALLVSIDGNISTLGINTATGTVGWPGMNSIITGYITQANDEITSITNNKSRLVNVLNTVYNSMGRQLLLEQRARFILLSPVPTPRDNRINQYPNTIINFTDALGTMANNTYPHMYAQTIEAISNLDNIGGQSIVGLMRQERNKSRLQKIGIELDTDIPGVMGEDMCPVLLSNNTIPMGKVGIDVVGINGNITNPTTTYTVPSVLLQKQDSTTISTIPLGYYDPNTNDYIKSTAILTKNTPIQDILKVSSTTINTNVNLLGPNNNGTGPAAPKLGISATTKDEVQSGQTDTGINGVNVVQIQPIAVVTSGAVVGSMQGSPLDIGKSEVLGSLAGSQSTNLVPCTLNSPYTSSVLLPNQLTVEEAIEEVIKCNCDCWVD